jgi:Flp pilus assembly protein TadB
MEHGAHMDTWIVFAAAVIAVAAAVVVARLLLQSSREARCDKQVWQMREDIRGGRWQQ